MKGSPAAAEQMSGGWNLLCRREVWLRYGPRRLYFFLLLGSTGIFLSLIEVFAAIRSAIESQQNDIGSEPFFWGIVTAIISIQIFIWAYTCLKWRNKRSGPEEPDIQERFNHTQLYMVYALGALGIFACLWDAVYRIALIEIYLNQRFEVFHMTETLVLAVVSWEMFKWAASGIKKRKAGRGHGPDPT
ncbi:MAG: hypothetical protein KJ017_11315 [Alphaproteobacteria bacterium]|nr:hypothetical protein [Alphaproteobacteria bacterium]